MKKSSACMVIFAAGAAVGYLFATVQLRKKYERITEDEVASVKASFRKYRDIDTKEPVKNDANVREDYEMLVNNLGYSDAPFPVEKSDDETHIIITEEAFSELDDYETLSLIYLADCVLVDDDYSRMTEEEIKGAIGNVDLNAFADDEAVDAMYVKNTKLKVAYEIIKDDRSYAELLESKPYLGL